MVILTTERLLKQYNYLIQANVALEHEIDRLKLTRLDITGLKIQLQNNQAVIEFIEERLTMNKIYEPRT